MKKKIPWFNVLFIVLLLIMIGLLIYNTFLFQNKENQEVKKDAKTELKKKKKTKIEKKKEEEQGSELSVTDANVLSLMKPFKIFNDHFQGNYFGSIYHSEKTDLSSLSNDVKLFLAIHTLNDNKERVDDTLTSNQVDVAIKKLFGNISYHHDSLRGNSCKYNFVYNDSTKTYNHLEGSCGGVLTPFYEDKIISAVQYKNRIEITEVVGYFEYNTNSGAEPILELYNNDDEKIKIASNIPDDNSNHDNTLDTYKDQLYKYKFTFNLEDGNYYFNKIERQK